MAEQAKTTEQQPMSPALLEKNIGDSVIGQLTNLEKVGFNFPTDYNYTNAIKASMMVLNDVVDRNRQPALKVCTKNSICKALFKMATKGLDVSKKQGYFIVRGTELCFEESYFGTVTMARRCSTNFEPIANCVYEGDEFEFMIDAKTGRKTITKHIQKLENIDGKIIGAYAYITNEKGETDVEIMTKAQIDKSWSKSASTQQTVHKDFPDRMARRTVIKRACNMLINSTLEDRGDNGEELNEVANSNTASNKVADYADFEDVPTTTIEAPKDEQTEQVEQTQAEADPFATQG